MRFAATSRGCPSWCCRRRTTARRSTPRSPGARRASSPRPRAATSSLDAVRTAARRSSLPAARDLARASPPIQLGGDPRRSDSRTRQSEVMRLLAQGKPNKLICRDLGLSEGTVKVHVSGDPARAQRPHARAGDRRARAPRRRHVDVYAAAPATSVLRPCRRSRDSARARRARARRPGRNGVRELAAHHAVDAARRGALLAFAMWSQVTPRRGGWRGSRWSSVNQVWRWRLARSVAAAAARARRRAALGTLLGRRLGAGAAHCGDWPRSSMFPASAAAPGAADRVPVRRRARRAQPHRRVPPVVLRLRAAGAGAADRPRGAGKATRCTSTPRS